MFARIYVMLRAAEGGGAGFARVEMQHGRGRITVHASQVGQGVGMLRVLLLAGDAQTGSVLDLGLMPVSGKGCGTLRRENIAFPGTSGTGGYHSLLLAADWPEPRLILYGALVAPPAYPLWQLREALARYLAVPTPDTPLNQSKPEAVDTPDAACTEASAACDRPCDSGSAQTEARTPITCPEPPSDAPRPVLTVHCLPPLIWPEAIAELKVYFDTLPPFAPFDAPGWRFVRVPLPGQNPAPYCAVGIRMRGRSITEVAYAIPGQPGNLPPGGLRGYRWQAGRNGQGYWTLWQGIRSA